MKWYAWMLAAVGVAAFVSSADGQPTPPCDRCKPADASWDWKANGYAVGDDGDSALAAAKQGAIDSGCATSQTYLAATKLKCKAGCDAGEESTQCAPSKEPKCMQGSYDSDKGMWTFVCRKFYANKPDAPACDEAEAKRHPGYGMCDVHVRMVRSLACSAPDCP